jgi:hypothetical protein
MGVADGLLGYMESPDLPRCPTAKLAEKARGYQASDPIRSEGHPRIRTTRSASTSKEASAAGGGIFSQTKGRGIHGTKTQKPTPQSSSSRTVLEVRCGERSEVEIGSNYDVHNTTSPTQELRRPPDEGWRKGCAFPTPREVPGTTPGSRSSGGRFETENGELVLEAKTLEEVERIVAQQLDYYNRKRRHSELASGRPYEVVLSARDGEEMRP